MIRTLAFIVAGLSLIGCAVTPQQFYQNPYAVLDAALCRASQSKTTLSGQFSNDVSQEIVRRGLNVYSCHSIIASQNAKIVVGLAAVGGIAYGLSKVQGGGGGGGGGRNGNRLG